MQKTEKIRRDMMELWKETFHDSSRYIDLVFENYFSLENVFTRYHENRLIAALLCVPYKFQILTKDGEKKISMGMYLCGLATRPEFRRKGIMADLMAEAESDIRERGYVLSFLIPANSHLRDYYRMKGYRNASYRKRRRISGYPQKSISTLNIYSIHKVNDEGDSRLVESLAEWCHHMEKDDPHSRILHSKKDMLAVIEENENSIFLTEKSFDVKNPILANVVAVAFPEEQEDSIGHHTMVLTDIYVDKHKIEAMHLEEDGMPISNEVVKSICGYYHGESLELIESYEGLQTPEEGEEPYAMVKMLDPNENSAENENLIFKISLMLD